MELIKRNEYVQWLTRYKNKQIIKVATGLRRIGKSKTFEIYIDELKNNDVFADNIILINFEEMENASLREKMALYQHIIAMTQQGKILYVFLDEVQIVPELDCVAVYKII